MSLLTPDKTIVDASGRAISSGPAPQQFHVVADGEPIDFGKNFPDGALVHYTANPAKPGAYLIFNASFQVLASALSAECAHLVCTALQLLAEGVAEAKAQQEAARTTDAIMESKSKV